MIFFWVVASFACGFITAPSLSLLREHLNKPNRPGKWVQIGRCLCCDAGFEESDMSGWLKLTDRRICSQCGTCDPKEPADKKMILWIGRWSGTTATGGRKIYEWLSYEKMPEDLRPERDPLMRLADALKDHD